MRSLKPFHFKFVTFRLKNVTEEVTSFRFYLVSFSLRQIANSVHAQLINLSNSLKELVNHVTSQIFKKYECNGYILSIGVPNKFR